MANRGEDEMTTKLGHQKVLYEEVQRYRAVVDTENAQAALCSHCGEFAGSATPCSESCGLTYVWVDDVTFVKMRLEGFA